MILVEDVIHKEGKKYIRVKIWTACCKDIIIVEDQGNDKLYDILRGEYLLWGMVESVRKAEKYYNENMLPLQN